MAERRVPFKALLVGRPKETARLEHERLTKKVGLAVFASDNLSSSAYATEEMLHVLIVGGSAALFYAIPITIAITAVLAIIAVSYRETIHAYPSGGGAYIVAHQNLGRYPGLVAAAALLIDYVLTVSVSISAGIAALTSAAPGLNPYRVHLSLVVIILITVLNLRGVRESGAIFALPTYAFIVLLGGTIVWGLVRYLVFGYRVPAPPTLPALQPITIFLLMRAFSHGSTAVTGIEAISNGVQAFRKPEARNAAVTLSIMAAILGFLFVGTTTLSFLFHITGPGHDPERTVVALIALKVFGLGPLFYAVQAATALILFLAANTSYADFPRLSAALARDRFAPRQLMNRGDRLAFSNGIIGLAALASVLVVIYDADVSRLINLYVVGVFTSLTLSQTGMVRHWAERRESEPRWRRQLAVNAVGAVATFIVLGIVLATKFRDGAWMVVAGIPALVWIMNATSRHYQTVARQLRDPDTRPQPASDHTVVVLVDGPGPAERRAVAYARLIHRADIHCVHFGPLGPQTDLAPLLDDVLDLTPSIEIVPVRASLTREVRAYVTEHRSRLDPSSFLTVIVPERLRPGTGGWVSARGALLLKASLLFTPGVVVTDVPTLESADPRHSLAGAGRHVVILLVSAAHHGTLRALEYARTLHTDEIHAIHVEIDPGETGKVVFEWDLLSPGLELEVLDSPFREIAQPVRTYVRRLTGPEVTVTLILPEFVVRRSWHNLLHNQNALQIKRAFLFEPNVVVTSVPIWLR